MPKSVVETGHNQHYIEFPGGRAVEVLWIVCGKSVLRSKTANFLLALNRHIPDLETLRHEAVAWAQRCNVEQAGVDQQFTTDGVAHSSSCHSICSIKGK